MIKKLQIKFIISTMSMLSIIMFLIFSSFNVIMLQNGEKQIFNMLKEMADKDQRKPEMRDNLKNARNSILIKLNNENEILEIHGNNIFSDDEIQTMVKDVLKNKKESGTINSEKYLIQNKPYGKILVFIDNSFEENLKSRLFFTSIMIGTFSMITMFFMSLFISNWAIKPVKKTFEKQKQFVADASHELKTPLAVIKANTDVLKNEIKDNKWLEYIEFETNRMNLLVNDLLYLASSDNEIKIQLQQFNLSNLVFKTTLPFESIAYENKINLILNVDKNIFYKGDENKIKQVLIILIDNAIKNTNNGDIIINLTTKQNKCYFEIKNTHDGIKDLQKIFERFYRDDVSRNRETGGYGLGLPIAKTIIDAHFGKIIVNNENGFVVFKIIL